MSDVIVDWVVIDGLAPTSRQANDIRVREARLAGGAVRLRASDGQPHDHRRYDLRAYEITGTAHDRSWIDQIAALDITAAHTLSTDQLGAITGRLGIDGVSISWSSRRGAWDWSFTFEETPA